jgi:hypothetical protein
MRIRQLFKWLKIPYLFRMQKKAYSVTSGRSGYNQFCQLFPDPPHINLDVPVTSMLKLHQLFY